MIAVIFGGGTAQYGSHGPDASFRPVRVFRQGTPPMRPTVLLDTTADRQVILTSLGDTEAGFALLGDTEPGRVRSPGPRIRASLHGS